MRRRKAGSISWPGGMLVEKITSASKGSEKLLPVCSFMKSLRLSSGTIQRFSNASGLTSWRPKSSIRNVPFSAFTCSGAS